MRRLRTAIGAALVVGAALIALPAHATSPSQQDPNDTPGLLDVRRVTLAPGRTPRWRITTSASWTIRRLWDAGYLIVQLDTVGDPGVDHLVVVRSDGRRLLATLMRLRADGSERPIATLRASKQGGRTVGVSVPLGRLTIGPDRTSYLWSVLTTFTGGACPQTCLDHVPDTGAIEQPLPGVTPTPTPTPTATPSPTPSPSPSPSAAG